MELCCEPSRFAFSQDPSILSGGQTVGSRAGSQDPQGSQTGDMGQTAATGQREAADLGRVLNAFSSFFFC